MSVSRHHADWLSLVEVSGPFVSLPVLLRVFPQGLEPRDPAQAKALRSAYAEWQENLTAPGTQRAWVLYVLSAVLGYPQEQIAAAQTLPAGLEANIAEMGETLRPELALLGPAGAETAGHAQLLITHYPPEQALGKPVMGKHWKASPATRMVELLHGANIPLGLVTNGEHWMLVHAPRGETTGYASWYGALWLDEPITLRAFHSLLGVRRFFGVAPDSTLLALLKESAGDQQEVTDQLGYQVRDAVEVLVQSFDALDRESNRVLLKGVHESALYEAALTVMMRLVFLFSAEERGLLHLGKPLYDHNYAVSTLQEQLQEIADRHGEEVLERRCDAWSRLLATFRAVHGGIRHQDLLMQAYGGSLFDPDRYAFLEGRPLNSTWHSATAEPLAVNNRVVLHLLNSLQRLRTRIGAGGTVETRRISFRALGVEQIGHVYEGLLDHTAVRADEPVLGLKGTRNKEPEVPLSELEALRAKGLDQLTEYLEEATDRSATALRSALEGGDLFDEHKLLIACAQDKDLLDRLRPFIGLLRQDSFERPLVVLPGSVYMTAGTTRRSTGTHYTPASLTAPTVQHALEPLIYAGPAEGWPREQWQLKSPKAILDLKVCDLAMGSGAFLVQACRYLAERLVEGWENEEKQHPGQVLITPEGQFSAGAPNERLVPADVNERIAIARRVVADRCLYGVDVNPMAVEMAKLSLWLVTIDAHRPFTFLDHAFKCGDSLLGITSLEQLENFSLRPGGGKQQILSTLNLRRQIEEARRKREELEVLPSETPHQIAIKGALHAEAEDAVAKLNAAADILMAVELMGLKGRTYEKEREVTADHMMACWTKGLPELQRYAHETLGMQRTFHWALAFPEIMERGGFHAIVGNPPYMGGPKLTGAFGVPFRGLLVSHIAEGRKGAADLATYFLLRATALCHEGSLIGLITTSGIAEGDSREVGLDYLTEHGWNIIRANARVPWLGAANVTYSSIWLLENEWLGPRLLDERPVSRIDSGLNESNASYEQRFALRANASSFNGAKIYGPGFLLSRAEADALMASDPIYADVLFPYLIGEDINSRPDCSSDVVAIRFFDWPLDRQEMPAGYNGPVAADYPKCLAIVAEKVQPGRQRLIGRNSIGTRRGNTWWLYGSDAKSLYRALETKEWALAIATQATKYVCFVQVPVRTVFSHALTIIADDRYSTFAVLNSSLHEIWARRYGSYNLALIRYSPSDLYATFPFPLDLSRLDLVGKSYNSWLRRHMLERNEGITEYYNRFHDPANTDADVQTLRDLQVDMDRLVAAAYDWRNVDLGHDFHPTKQGLRFTLSETARREILERLLALNHQRHAEEEAELAVQPRAAPAKRGRKKLDSGGQTALDL